MTRRHVLIVGCFAAALGAGAAFGQAPPADDERRPAVREQMRRLFAARLKADVGLDDAQVGVVLPQIESLERQRVRRLGERRALLRELRRGLEAGMADADLQKRLEALDRIGNESERETRDALKGIDRELTVPQRVRLRFLIGTFRREMTHRVQELGRERHRGAR
jgi:hypothetical protein